MYCTQLEEVASIRDQLQRGMNLLSYVQQGEVSLSRLWSLLDNVFADWCSYKKQNKFDDTSASLENPDVPAIEPSVDEWDMAEADMDADADAGKSTDPSEIAGAGSGWGAGKSAAKYLFSGCEMDADAKPIRAKRLAPIASPKPADSASSGWWMASK